MAPSELWAKFYSLIAIVGIIASAIIKASPDELRRENNGTVCECECVCVDEAQLLTGPPAPPTRRFVSILNIIFFDNNIFFLSAAQSACLDCINLFDRRLNREKEKESSTRPPVEQDHFILVANHVSQSDWICFEWHTVHKWPIIGLLLRREI